MMTDVSTMTDSELEYRLLMANKLIQKHEQELEAARAMKANTQRELDRRALDAWWAAHPEQTRVNVGDRLLITRELLEYRTENGGWPKLNLLDYVGETCTFAFMERRGDEWTGDIDTLHGYTGIIPMHIIQDMRRAYLQAHPESEGDR